jgi:hypothetical protein
MDFSYVPESLLFLYLWVPLLQEGLDEWAKNYNSFKRRFDQKSMLPTGCSAYMCYGNPNDHDSDEGLIPIDCLVIGELERQHHQMLNLL